MFNILILMLLFTVLLFIYKDTDEEQGFLSRKYTNVIKGIAITFVLITHIGQSYGVSIIEPLAGICVCMFLIVSGYGVNEAYKKKGKENYFKSRFKRVVVPYWIVAIIYLIISNKFDLQLLISSLLLIKLPTPIFWYLRIIVYWYIVFYICKKIENRKQRYSFIMFMSCLISIVFLRDILYIWQIFSFPLGIVMSENVELFKSYIEDNYKKIIKVSFLISLVAVILKKTPYVDSRTFGVCDTTLQIVLSLSMAIFIGMIVYVLRDIKMWGFLQQMGKKSFEIYLVHPFFLYLLSNTSVSTMFVYLLIVLVLTFILNNFVGLVNKLMGKFSCIIIRKRALS